ncbi:MAG: CsgG/HfaB family protein [Nitrospiraceae bacterium]
MMFGCRVLLVLASLLFSHCTPPPAVAPEPSRPQSASHASIRTRFPSPLVISVLYFEDRSHLPELAWLRKGMTDMLVAKLARNPSLLVVQRERLEEVIREQAFQLSGRVADESAVRVGRLTGATVLVTGSISLMDGLLRIDAQLSGVEQGTVLGTAMAEGLLTAVPSVTRSLIMQVMELLPGATGEQTVMEGESGVWSSAKANQTGETLSRAGKMFQALEEFEHALAANPDDPAPRSNYSKAVRMLSAEDMVKMSNAESVLHNDRAVASRIVERLTGRGIEADIGPSRGEAQADGSVTLSVPVRFRLDARTVAAVLESVQALGGQVEEKPGEDGVIEVALPSRSALNAEFLQAIGRPRRIYLRLLSATGQTIAVYSDFLQWRLSSWITSGNEGRAGVATRRVLSSEAQIVGLAPDQIAAVSAVKVTVDEVPNERAVVRVDLADPKDQAHEEIEVGSPREPFRRFREPAPSGALSASLRAALERAWNPPVSERPWGHRYLPSNERTAAVIMLFSRDDESLREAVRLARPSGDAGFDAACMRAARAAAKHWREHSGEWRLWLDQLSRMANSTPISAKERVLKARAHFRLRKDVPALNLIGAQDLVEPLRPVLSGEPRP